MGKWRVRFAWLSQPESAWARKAANPWTMPETIILLL